MGTNLLNNKSIFIILTFAISAFGSKRPLDEFLIRSVKSEFPLIISNNHLTYAEIKANSSKSQNIYIDIFHNNSTRICRFDILGPNETFDWNISLTSAPKFELITYYTISFIDRSLSLDVAFVNRKNCQVTKIKVPYMGETNNDLENFKKKTVILDNSGYNLIVPNENLCGSKLCRINFNPITSMFSTIAPVPGLENIELEEDWELVPTTSYTKSSYFLVIKNKSPKSNIVVISVRGDDVIHKSLNLQNYDFITSEGISTTNDLIGLCYPNGTTLNSLKCEQMDRNLKSVLTVNFTYPIAIKRLTSLNPQGGGFFLLTLDNAELLTIYLFDNKGKSTFVLDIGALKCGLSKSTTTLKFLDIDNNTCLQFACREFSTIKRIHINTIWTLCV